MGSCARYAMQAIQTAFMFCWKHLWTVLSGVCRSQGGLRQSEPTKHVFQICVLLCLVPGGLPRSLLLRSLGSFTLSPKTCSAAFIRPAAPGHLHNVVISEEVVVPDIHYAADLTDQQGVVIFAKYATPCRITSDQRLGHFISAGEGLGEGEHPLLHGLKLWSPARHFLQGRDAGILDNMCGSRGAHPDCLPSVAALLAFVYLVYDLQLIMGGKNYAISPDEYIF
eukprot:scaffold137307_cov27-Tisochrysis_lutea.AAC.1